VKHARRLARVAFVVLPALFAACAPKEVQLQMAVEVVSQPEAAEVSFRGKAIGQAPTNVAIKTYEDLQSILAVKGDLNIIEKRLRILAPDRAQLIFKFGKGEQSPLAKVLGVQNVLIFDYSEKVSFDVDKFDLKPDALPILNTQADILNVYFPKAQVFVCGYTDATGTDEHNLKLSLKRAQAVADYLAARQVDKARLQIRGFGKDYAVESNATPAGRTLNRRTEVILPQ
jgi:outer membrane protein OmpA-like peptidoglycan-associated protein